jgi:hypothetical protein
MEAGFVREAVIKALRAFPGDINKAADHLLSLGAPAKAPVLYRG